MRDASTGGPAPRGHRHDATDDVLARRLLDGDTAAFETAFRAYHTRLCDFALTIVDGEDVAEEIVQDVFAGLWRMRASLHITTSLRAYLYTSVRNRCLNDRRRTRRERPLERVRDTDLVSSASNPHAHAESTETTIRVRVAIEQLPPRCREAIVLRWIHGLGYADIAATMDISIKAVENHVNRGLHALRELLADLA